MVNNVQSFNLRYSVVDTMQSNDHDNRKELPEGVNWDELGINSFSDFFKKYIHPSEIKDRVMSQQLRDAKDTGMLIPLKNSPFLSYYEMSQYKLYERKMRLDENQENQDDNIVGVDEDMFKMDNDFAVQTNDTNNFIKDINKTYLKRYLSSFIKTRIGSSIPRHYVESCITCDLMDERTSPIDVRSVGKTIKLAQILRPKQRSPKRSVDQKEWSPSRKKSRVIKGGNSFKPNFKREPMASLASQKNDTKQSGGMPTNRLIKKQARLPRS